jgi:hypothetical protein
VNPNTDCERVRMTLMASLDGESDPESAPDRQHVLTCASCRRWLENLESMTSQLHGLPYQDAQVDLWTAVESQIRQTDEWLTLSRRLWPVGAVVLVWRAVQLFVDLPVPLVPQLVPLTAAVVAMWLVVGNPLAIATSAPELQKRGI